MRSKLLLALCLLAVATILTAVASTPAAFADPPRVGNIDLFWDTEHLGDGVEAKWKFIVRAREERVAIENVKVQFTPPPLPGATIEVAEGDSFDHATGVWTIQAIPPGGGAEIEVNAREFFTLVISPTRSELVPHRILAEIIESTPAEPPGNKDNNAVEGWAMNGFSSSLRWTQGDTGVYVGIDNREPESGEQVTFTVVARNDGSNNRVEGERIRAATHYINDQLDVEVAIELSPGLAYGPNQAIDFDPISGIWTVGDLSDLKDCERTPCRNQNYPNRDLVEIPVDIVSTDIPLEQRCLTATVKQAVPAFELDPSKRANDVAKVCLGKELVVISGGEIPLWWGHDCVGRGRPQEVINFVIEKLTTGSRPCGAQDELKLFTHIRHGDISLPGLQRRDTFDTEPMRGDQSFLDPGSVIVQIRDPSGRVYDGHSASVTSSNVVSWQTANKGTHGQRIGFDHQRGVSLVETLEHLAGQASDWQTFGPFTVTKGRWQGQDAPGRFKIRNASNGGNWFDPNPSAIQPSFTNANWLTPLKTFVEFETLGTYVLTYEVKATRSDGVTTYSDVGTYRFHVGPIAELEVRDGGGSPLAGTGQRAYTILAANNGPDTAPAVRVTLSGVPQGAKAAPPRP